MFAQTLDPIHEIFNNETFRPILSRLRYAISFVFFILLLRHIKAPLFFPGLYVSLFGELIQIWSFASLDKNRTLATQGPYMIMRNPMYVGRFFILAGFLFLTGNILIISGFSVLYCFYAVNRVKREEKRLSRLFGEAYENYCQKVNRFMPSFKMFKWRPLFFFKGDLLLRNHGHLNLIAVFSCYAAIYFSLSS